MDELIKQLQSEIKSLKENRMRGASSLTTKSWNINTTFSFNNNFSPTRYLILTLTPKNRGKVFLWNVTQNNVAPTFTFNVRSLFNTNTNVVEVWTMPINSSNVTTTINPIITINATDDLTITTQYKDYNG